MRIMESTKYSDYYTQISSLVIKTKSVVQFRFLVQAYVECILENRNSFFFFVSFIYESKNFWTYLFLLQTDG